MSDRKITYPGPPTNGWAAVMDVVEDINGVVWVCSAAGSPGTWAQAASSPPPSGTPIVRHFPFAYNTPNILTGAALYTPTVGDILHDAWFSILTPWNGTTPRGDVSQYTGTGGAGWFGHGGAGPSTSSISMVVADAVDMDNAGTSPLSQPNAGPPTLLSLCAAETIVNRLVPAKFINATPIKVCVTQTGVVGGADPGATQGSAVLYLVTSTPV